MLVQQPQQSRAMRQKNPTSFDMISDPTNSTRYRRRKETTDTLTYIHGGEEGAAFGAWDFFASRASKVKIVKCLANYKKGRYVQDHVGRAVMEHNKSPSFKSCYCNQISKLSITSKI